MVRDLGKAAAGGGGVGKVAAGGGGKGSDGNIQHQSGRKGPMGVCVSG